MDLHLNPPHYLGTIVGVTYDGGVVLGTDSRMTVGMLVANDSVSDKITQLSDQVYICRSGPAAVSEVLSDYVRNILDQHTVQFGQPATVKQAANLVRLFSYKNTNIIQMGQVGMIVGGWDKYEGGQIFAVAQGGTILKLPYAIDGSCSSGIKGFFDRAWKEGMSKDKAEKLVVKAVSLSIADEDEGSGGLVRTVTINSDGVMKNCYPPDSLPLCDDEINGRRRRRRPISTELSN